jgi:hypothetical protein
VSVLLLMGIVIGLPAGAMVTICVLLRWRVRQDFAGTVDDDPLDALRRRGGA